MATLDELHAQLDELEAALPGLLAEHPDDADFWPAFAGMADVIEDCSGPHCLEVAERINAMLVVHGRALFLVR